MSEETSVKKPTPEVQVPMPTTSSAGQAPTPTQAQAPTVSTQEPVTAAIKWSCELTPESSSADMKNLTVGQKMNLNCNGEPLANPLNDKAQIQFGDEKQKYTLHILEVQNSDYQKAQFLVTSYKPGKHTSGKLFITDGSQKIQVNEGLNWEMQSVLPKGQPPMAYASLGPFKLSMPWWYWTGIILTLAVIGFFVFKRIKKYLDRKKLIEGLALHGTALSPYNQYNKEIRNIRREFFSILHGSQPKETHEDVERCLRELDQSFRMFLLREFLVPANEWSSSDVIKEIKSRHHKVFLEFGDEIKRILKELDRAKKNEASVSLLDCEQLTFMGQNLGEKLTQFRRIGK